MRKVIVLITMILSVLVMNSTTGFCHELTIMHTPEVVYSLSNGVVNKSEEFYDPILDNTNKFIIKNDLITTTADLNEEDHNSTYSSVEVWKLPITRPNSNLVNQLYLVTSVKYDGTKRAILKSINNSIRLDLRLLGFTDPEFYYCNMDECSLWIVQGRTTYTVVYSIQSNNIYLHKRPSVNLASWGRNLCHL